MDIRLNPDNPRQINPEKFAKLKQSIKDFPKMLELRPIVVDKDGIILGGNMRFMALTELGMEIKDEWVKVADKLTDEERKRFIVEDNLPFGEWDWDALSTQYDIDELLEWGFDEKELKIEKEVEEDEVPEVSDEPAVSKLGEVYQLGRHRLMCGDSTKIEDVEKLMDGQKADMVFTDPPYGMFLNADYSGMEGISKGNKYNDVIGDHEDFKPEFITSVFKNFGYCKDIFLWGADYYSELLEKRNAGSWIVWDKMQGGEGVNDKYDKMFGSNFELCWSKARHKRAIARVLWKGIFGLGVEDTKKRVHPTQKPVKLADWFISKFTKENDLVADIYLGGGSTLIACEQTNRICYGIELDEKYCDVIRKRYAKFIGKEDKWQTITPQI